MIDTFKDVMFGPGFCKCCRLLKPLAMVEMTGYREEEQPFVKAEVLLDPHTRQGYCFDCAPEILKQQVKKG